MGPLLPTYLPGLHIALVGVACRSDNYPTGEASRSATRMLNSTCTRISSAATSWAQGRLRITWSLAIPILAMAFASYTQALNDLRRRVKRSILSTLRSSVFPLVQPADIRQQRSLPPRPQRSCSKDVHPPRDTRVLAPGHAS